MKSNGRTVYLVMIVKPIMAVILYHLQLHHLSTEITSDGLEIVLAELEDNSGGSYRLKRVLVSLET